MSDIFTALSTEKPDGSFYQLNTETGTLQHLDKKWNMLGEADISSADAHVTIKSRKTKRALLYVYYAGTGAVVVPFVWAISPILGIAVGGLALATAISTLAEARNKADYAEVRLQG